MNAMEIESTAVVSRMESLCRSSASAMLTESQRTDLDGLCVEVKRLCREGRGDDAVRVVGVARSLITGGPPS